jgi:glycosyltransferase involved in cell wall biosynthesis
MPKPKISAVLLVKNHERHIGPCLRTLAWVDEVILVNDSSSDRTLEIARGFDNVKILDRALNGDWSGQMNFGIESASGDWIFQIDVDERVPEELAAELQQLALREDIAGIGLLIMGTFLGQLRGHAPGSGTAVRMVRRGKGIFDPRFVHSRIQVDGKVVDAENVLVHLGPFPTAQSFWLKNTHYAEVEARYNAEHRPGMIGTSTWALAFAFVVKPVGIFCQKYFMQGGWREGIYGLHYAIMRAIGYYMVYVATWERLRGECDEVKAYCDKHGIPHLDELD